ncbi:hypothetical protein PV10_04325 [Exophiala mesophila]|uniref:Uncharacterized protein n=1 Tax=Exophiala mesophila TaxID=212818 RepID=A0A0D1XXZ6_EXOME|nr:uncharacterized protein PV10_04325 [Exophiala mesophila]KIV93081.1 hypothetical protein PV10_04325 [Exophiala mesophila]
MPSVVTKIKDALHGDHDSRDEYRSDGLERSDDRISGTHGHGSSNLPGSYPGQESGTSQAVHQDGREYVAPHGTAVGQQSQNTGGSLDPVGSNQPHSRTTTTTQTSTHGGFGDASQGYGTTGHPQDRPLGEIQPGTRGQNEVTDDRNLMDPASRGTGSNVLDGSRTGTDTTSGGGLGHDSRSTGSNKLHRRDDPRGYESNPGHSSTTHGSSNVAGSGVTSGHKGQGQHLREEIADPNDRRHAGGSYGTDQYDDKTRSSHHDPSRAAAVGAGGVGAGLAASQIPDRSRRHDNDDSRHASSNIGGNQSYDTASSGTSRHDYAGRDTGRDTGHGGIYNTVVGAGSEDDHTRPHGAHGTHGSGIGSGSGPGPTGSGRQYESHPGTTSGLSGQGHVPREAGDGRHTTSGGRSGLSGPEAAGLAAAGAGVGAAGAYGASRAHDRDGDRAQGQGQAGGQYSDTGLGSRGGGPDTSMNPSAYPAQSQSQSQFQQPGAMGQGPTGRGAMARDSNAIPGAGGMGPSSSSSSGGGGHGLDSLPPGARLLHKCTHCGQDNDISHYLRKDVAYRIEQQ